MASLIVRAKTIVTCDTDNPQCGIDFDALGRIDDAAMLVEDGVIKAIGESRVILSGATLSPSKWSSAEERHEVNFPNHLIVPGFVDAHAHPLFAGDREPDFAARSRGEPPKQGMRYTIERTREALLDPVTFYENTLRLRLSTMLAHGTTTLETKTGYALHRPGEAELLDIIAAHRDDPDVPRLVATFLGAHALPPEFEIEREDGFIDYLIDQVVPVAAAHGAVYADAFCEPGFFSPEQTRRYLDAARLHGMRLRVHCDEMAYGGAAAMAAQLEVDAVDHCNFISDSDVRAIAECGIVAVACPATIEFLDLPATRAGAFPLRGGGRGRARQRLQSRHLTLFQSSNRRLLRAQALRALGRGGAIRRHARGGALAACRGRVAPHRWSRRFCRVANGLAP